jgi:hypothetical protein
MAQIDLELDTTIRKVFGSDRGLIFGRPGAMRDRLAQWALSLLWLAAAAVLVAVW